MHPLGLYLALDDIHREHGRVDAHDRPAPFLRVDAVPTAEPAPGSRIARLAAIARRRLLRPAGA